MQEIEAFGSIVRRGS